MTIICGSPPNHPFTQFPFLDLYDPMTPSDRTEVRPGVTGKSHRSPYTGQPFISVTSSPAWFF